jgi:hypothetical protein
MEDREDFVGIVVGVHGGLEEVWAQRACRQLEYEAVITHGVVVADDTVFVGAHDVAPGTGGVGHEGRVGPLGTAPEAGVVGGAGSSRR